MSNLYFIGYGIANLCHLVKGGGGFATAPFYL